MDFFIYIIMHQLGIAPQRIIANRLVSGLAPTHQTILDVFHTFSASKISKLS